MTDATPRFDTEDQALNEALARSLAGGREEQDQLLELLFKFRGRLVGQVYRWLDAAWEDAEDAVARVYLTLCSLVRTNRLAPPTVRWWLHMYSRARRQYWKNIDGQPPWEEMSPEEHWDSDEYIRKKPERWLRNRFPGPDCVDLADEWAMVLRKAARCLSPVEQTILRARAREMSYREIAKVLGTTEQTVRVQFMRLKEKLRNAG